MLVVLLETGRLRLYPVYLYHLVTPDIVKVVVAVIVLLGVVKPMIFISGGWRMEDEASTSLNLVNRFKIYSSKPDSTKDFNLFV
jgi:hypothetical protein